MSPALAAGFFTIVSPGKPWLDPILPWLVGIFIFKLGIIMTNLFIQCFIVSLKQYFIYRFISLKVNFISSPLIYMCMNVADWFDDIFCV